MCGLLRLVVSGGAVRLERRSNGGNTYLDGMGLDLDPEALRLLAVAAVELVEHLAAQLDLHGPRLRREHERRLARRAGRRAGERSRPFDEAVRGHEAELEQPV